MHKTLLLCLTLAGCSFSDAQYPFGAPPAEVAEVPPEDVVINIGAKHDAPVAAIKTLPATPAANGARRTFTGEPQVVPAPELANINRYARALEDKLLRRYNNTPTFAGKIGKVQVLPVGEPKTSLDGQKIKIEWSQVVFDIWGERIPELEKEFYVVTFGDGKPAMQRTRPTITAGLNNEGGYSEFSAVRGGVFSGRATGGDPALFDRPDSERRQMLDDNLNDKNATPGAYEYYDLPALGEKVAAVKDRLPVIAPAPENLTAVVVQPNN
ncbi:hypothetical protein FACS1894139_06320 [Planctomycetales bacterium]|nr:hypothetical protein FACS1894107_08110 [Planctomycetales bacterium]GHS96108.1 hypothetical protein FACS1894108_00120 [Planctomycetales bacterium]GHT04335.1 hypothetical protein FACS1894139_06320 [Planctomycetales bacterium]